MPLCMCAGLLRTRATPPPRGVWREGWPVEHYVTLVLRLVVDQRGRVRRGEFIDVGATTTPVRFLGWRGLIHVMSTLLAPYRRKSRFERTTGRE
jgi:hypothetical protein